MDIFIQTRSIHKDYCFLANEPSNKWWQYYSRYTSFEHPTVIVESNAKGWRAYLAGAKSSRLDKVNTPIRYSFVLESQEKLIDSQRILVLGLIQNWLDAINNEDMQIELQHKLGKLFDTETVEQYIDLKQAVAPKISDQFFNWLKQHYQNQNSHEPQPININRSQIGAVQSSKAQTLFLQYCAEILNTKVSKPTSALYLNFIETEDELNAESTALKYQDEYERQFIILVNDTDNKLKTTIKSVEQKKKPTQSFNPEEPRENAGSAISYTKSNSSYSKQKTANSDYINNNDHTGDNPSQPTQLTSSTTTLTSKREKIKQIPSLISKSLSEAAKETLEDSGLHPINGFKGGLSKLNNELIGRKKTSSPDQED